jgi:hypothetical protein
MSKLMYRKLDNSWGKDRDIKLIPLIQMILQSNPNLNGITSQNLLSNLNEYEYIDDEPQSSLCRYCDRKY